MSPHQWGKKHSAYITCDWQTRKIRFPFQVLLSTPSKAQDQISTGELGEEIEDNSSSILQAQLIQVVQSSRGSLRGDILLNEEIIPPVCFRQEGEIYLFHFEFKVVIGA